MKRQRANKRHFLTHTAIELAWVFGILIVALLLARGNTQITGTPSGAYGTLSRNTLALGAVMGEATVVSEKMYPVEFSVQPGEGSSAVTCDNGHPATDVFFFVNPPNGGVIEIAREQESSFFVGTDHGPLKNGTYHWRGNPFSGFAPQGVTSGTFTLNAVCPTESAVGSVGAVGTTSTVLLPPEVYVNGIRVSSGALLSTSDVLLTFRNPDARAVTFIVMNDNGTRRALDTSQGVIENPPGVWSVRPPASFWTNSTQKIFALVYTHNDIVAESPSVTITFEQPQFGAHEPPRQGTAIEPRSPIVSPSVPLPPRPQLKFFVDERPIDIAQPIVSSILELRVIAPLAREVHLFTSASGTSTKLGVATRDDLLSLPGTDVWSYFWERGTTTINRTTVFARVNYDDGRVVETSPIMLTFAPPRSTDAGVGEIMTSVAVDVSAGEKQIIEHLRDPGQCTSMRECRIYCDSLKRSPIYEEQQFHCIDFARTERPGIGGRMSLADGIFPERIALILADPAKRPKWLPERITSVELFERYCAVPSHASDCARFLSGYDLASREMLEERTHALLAQAQEEKAVLRERVGVRVFLDTDGDDISDYDEINIYRTDPLNYDSDGDSVRDGAELLARTNPNGNAPIGESLDMSVGEAIEHADPFVDGVVAPELLALDHVEALPFVGDDNATNDDTNDATSRVGVVFSGKAPPASYVSLFIYSEPIVVVVKADESGNWTYLLEKELPDGTHEVWAAIVDSMGRIIVKSEPLSFVKTAQAITVGAEPPAQASAPSFLESEGLLAMFALLVALLGIILAVLGLIMSRHRMHEGNQALSPH